MLKKIRDEWFQDYTTIFNAILRLEYFPTQWKFAQVVVIPKPGKPAHQPSSYRPISLLPITSKIFEKLFLNKLEPILTQLNVIPSHQFGFRHQHSTIEQVHRVVNVIRQSLELKQYCSAAFLDVSQAFDKVWHLGLLHKIKSLLPHPFYNIIKSYLSQRHFQVKFLNTYSNIYKTEAGVPQGSVLGPVLYILYTADIPTSPGVTIATFADDTALMSSHQDPNIASQMLQSNLNNITEWLRRWKIKVNEAKSIHVTFTLKSNVCPPVSLNNVQLPQKDEVKYLGIYLDRRLTWKSHVWNKRLQLNLKYSKMAWLFTKKSKLSIESKLLLYKVLLKPVWTYGIQLWGTASFSNIQIIQRFQSKVLRAILQAPWFVSNLTIHSDVKISPVTEEISKFSRRYVSKLENHPNYLALNLLDNGNCVYRLKRSNILDLRF